MDNIPEREIKPPNHREIGLNEPFHPFEHERVGNDHLLLLKIGPWKLPLLIRETRSLDRIEYINPFNPSEGYQFDEEDYDLNKRKAKTARLILEGWKEKTIDANHFGIFLMNPDPTGDYSKYLESLGRGEREDLKRLLEAFINYDKSPLIVNELMRPMGLLDINNDEDMTLFRKGMLPLLKRLRLRVMAGNETLEGASEILFSRIAFSQFYPIDNGPLPSEEFTEETRRQLKKEYGSSAIASIIEEKGKRIVLPKDLSRLEQVQMMFTLEESPKDVRETTQK